MPYFEYKVIPAPLRRRPRQKRVDGMDKYASTISDLMTEMGLEGWDFIGAETMTERRRRFPFGRDVDRTLLVFRRQAQLHGFGINEESGKERHEPTLEPVRPRRVARPELIAAVANGARRIKVAEVAEAAESAPETAAQPTKPVAAE